MVDADSKDQKLPPKKLGWIARIAIATVSLGLLWLITIEGLERYALKTMMAKIQGSYRTALIQALPRERANEAEQVFAKLNARGFSTDDLEHFNSGVAAINQLKSSFHQRNLRYPVALETQEFELIKEIANHPRGRAYSK